MYQVTVDYAKANLEELCELLKKNGNPFIRAKHAMESRQKQNRLIKGRSPFC